jgi:hypothetical protein
MTFTTTVDDAPKTIPPTARVQSKFKSALDPSGPLIESPGKDAMPAVIAERITPRSVICWLEDGTNGANFWDATETVHVAADSDVRIVPEELTRATTTRGENGRGWATDAGSVSGGGRCKSLTDRRWMVIEACTVGRTLPLAKQVAVKRTIWTGSFTEDGNAGRSAMLGNSARPFCVAWAVVKPVIRTGAPITVALSEHDSSEDGLSVKSFQLVCFGGDRDEDVAGRANLSWTPTVKGVLNKHDCGGSVTSEVDIAWLEEFTSFPDAHDVNTAANNVGVEMPRMTSPDSHGHAKDMKNAESNGPTAERRWNVAVAVLDSVLDVNVPRSWMPVFAIGRPVNGLIWTGLTVHARDIIVNGVNEPWVEQFEDRQFSITTDGNGFRM